MNQFLSEIINGRAIQIVKNLIILIDTVFSFV